MPVLMRETGRSKFHFFGTSSGAIRAAAFAQAQPERVDRLVVAAVLEGDADLPDARALLEQAPRDLPGIEPPIDLDELLLYGEHVLEGQQPRSCGREFLSQRHREEL